MNINYKQLFSFSLISFCVISGTIDAQARMLTAHGNVKEIKPQSISVDSGKLKTVPLLRLVILKENRYPLLLTPQIIGGLLIKVSHYNL